MVQAFIGSGCQRKPAKSFALWLASQPLLAVVLVVASGQVQAGIIVYDVAADWSDASNPNGAWSYGTMSSPASFTAFPIHVSEYINTGGSPFTADQPAWTNSLNTGDQFNTPPEGLAKSIGVAAPGFDFPMGRVGGHTPTDVNKFLAIRWVAQEAGTIDFGGGVWMWRDINRINRLSLYVNGAALFDDVNIPEISDGVTSADTFLLSEAIVADGGMASSLTGIAVNPGDVVILAARRGPTFAHEDFIGFDFTITQTTPSEVPEPASAFLFATGFVVVASLRRAKHRRQAT